MAAITDRSPMTTGRHAAVTSGWARALAVISGPTPAGSPMVMPSTGTRAAVTGFLQDRGEEIGGAESARLGEQRPGRVVARARGGPGPARRPGAPARSKRRGRSAWMQRVGGVAAGDRDEIGRGALEDARGRGGQMTGDRLAIRRRGRAGHERAAPGRERGHRGRGIAVAGASAVTSGDARGEQRVELGAARRMEAARHHEARAARGQRDGGRGAAERAAQRAAEPRRARDQRAGRRESAASARRRQVVVGLRVGGHEGAAVVLEQVGDLLRAGADLVEPERDHRRAAAEQARPRRRWRRGTRDRGRSGIRGPGTESTRRWP